RPPPRVLDAGRVRAAVRVLVDGIPAAGIEVRRAQEHGLHGEAIARGHADELRAREAVLGQGGRGVRLAHAHLGAVRTVQAYLRRRREVAPGVEVESETGTEARGVCAFGAREPHKPRAVEVDPI